MAGESKRWSLRESLGKCETKIRIHSVGKPCKKPPIPESLPHLLDWLSTLDLVQLLARGLFGFSG